jgi:hypothetical protein
VAVNNLADNEYSVAAEHLKYSGDSKKIFQSSSRSRRNCIYCIEATSRETRWYRNFCIVYQIDIVELQ